MRRTGARLRRDLDTAASTDAPEGQPVPSHRSRPVLPVAGPRAVVRRPPPRGRAVRAAGRWPSCSSCCAGRRRRRPAGRPAAHPVVGADRRHPHRPAGRVAHPVDRRRDDRGARPVAVPRPVDASSPSAALSAIVIVTHLVLGYGAWAFYDASSRIFVNEVSPESTAAPSLGPGGSPSPRTTTSRRRSPRRRRQAARINILLTGIDSAETRYDRADRHAARRQHRPDHGRRRAHQLPARHLRLPAVRRADVHGQDQLVHDLGAQPPGGLPRRRRSRRSSSRSATCSARRSTTTPRSTSPASGG